MPERIAFEDFYLGQTFAFGDHLLTEDEIIAFAREFDPQPQHIDPEAAKHSVLDGLAASGWHLCALSMRMVVDGLFGHATSLGSPGAEEVQWRRPARPGDRLRMTGEVLEIRVSTSRTDRGFVRFRFDMLRDANPAPERVMYFTATVMFGKRGAADVA